MVLLVAVAKPFQDFDCFAVRGRLDHHHLEPAFQSAVFFDVFAVFVESRGSDTLQLAATECRFEHVRSVDGPLGAAGTHQSVQLVDEQDRILSAANFVHDGFNAFFELPAILRPGNHHR